jgi:hypothetical protein
VTDDKRVVYLSPLIRVPAPPLHLAAVCNEPIHDRDTCAIRPPTIVQQFDCGVYEIEQLARDGSRRTTHSRIQAALAKSGKRACPFAFRTSSGSRVTDQSPTFAGLVILKINTRIV